ncbi:thiol:disulfide interchange protein DsbD [Acinetobacter calcoaceticus]|uniref:Thiol:disulfide interchange protein DsbD n=1 Tax=Acinetobacter calcoaceticus TaxID=471 RepID=A0A4R1XBX4_ACICA|nr:thiol:disulfide interchange protein DsbD [Acinetobacter calcoaceticus]
MNLRLLLSLGFASVITFSAAQTFANPEFLPPDQAFQFSAESLSPQTAQLKWKIAPHYYLYHDQFKVTVSQQALKLELPAGKPKDDPTFGVTDVHYNQVSAKFQVKPNSQYLVVWQGCSDEGLCYPLQRRSIKTDAEGLLPQSATANGAGKRSIFGATTTNTLANNTNNANNSATPNAANDQTLTTAKTPNGAVPNSAQQPTSQLNAKTQTQVTAASAPSITPDHQANATTQATTIAATTAADNVSASSATAPNSQHALTEDAPVTTLGTAVNATEPSTDTSKANLQLNNDQGFFQLLSPDRLWLNLVIFFLLGVLLAFLPCSLPLIPILSGIIVQRASGYKAVAVALSFVISMALVYSLMGIVVAEIGYSFQRWFQSPIMIGLFAVLFVLLALNLFGLYQLSMPQRFVQVLDRLQNKQKGGTLIGAMIMGALSALIVGPCMSAPLAGALLFVSQSHNAFLGGVYLFILGLGIGLPLFITAVFGAKYLPKPGLWMDRIKIGFGFVMLMVAVYFVRPMIPSMLYSILLAVLCIALGIYLIYIRRSVSHKMAHISLILMAALSIFAAVWNIQHSYQAYTVQHSADTLVTWQKVRTADELTAALTTAKQLQKPILIDVYADWCVACQPIEKEVLPRADVQQAMAGYSLIKLDLTEYEASQDLILKDREILGPPTMLFLDAQGIEQRPLRLTGTFSAKQFIQQLNQANP